MSFTKERSGTTKKRRHFQRFTLKKYKNFLFIRSVIECLKRCDCDQSGFGSKRNQAILLCPWKRCFTAHFLCLAVLASSSKFQSYLSKKTKLTIAKTRE